MKKIIIEIGETGLVLIYETSGELLLEKGMENLSVRQILKIVKKILKKALSDPMKQITS